MAKDRTDRFADLRDAFKSATGKSLAAYVVIGIAEDGEAMYGASIGAHDAPAVLRELRKAVAFAADRAKVAA